MQLSNTEEKNDTFGISFFVIYMRAWRDIFVYKFYANDYPNT